MQAQKSVRSVGALSAKFMESVDFNEKDAKSEKVQIYV